MNIYFSCYLLLEKPFHVAFVVLQMFVQKGHTIFCFNVILYDLMLGFGDTINGGGT